MSRGGAGFLTCSAVAILTGCASTHVRLPTAVTPAAGPVAAVAAAPATPSPTWPDTGDCRGRAAAVLAMPEAGRERLPAGGATLAVAVVDRGGALLSPAEVPGHLEVDLPLALAREVGEADCLVVAGVARRTAEGGGRRLVGHEVVRSEYRSGTRRAADAGRTRRAARDEDDGGGGLGGLGVMRTGDPALDLVGLVAGGLIRGVGRLWSARDEAAAAGLGPDEGVAAPGPEAAVYRPYTYEVSLFEMERAGVVGAALVDRAAGRVHEARHAVRERRTFPLAKGRHAADRGLLERTGRQAVLEADLDLFAEQPPRPRLSDILRALAAGGGEGRPGGVAEATAVLARAGGEDRTAAVPGDAPAAGSATVRTAAGSTSGTWTATGLVEVPAASLGGSSLVEVTRPDGVRAFGLVERVDEATGRAVVRVGGPAGG